MLMELRSWVNRISLLLVIGNFYGCADMEQKEKLRIAIAANMQFVMEELTKEFSEQTGIDCEMVIASSGKLTAQINEGAPYDLFLAANMKYPQKVFDNGRAKLPPKVYAYGKLVVWTMKKGIEPSLLILTSNSIYHIALANPKTAPYGVAAKEVLEQSGIYQEVEKKLVFGESIAQTNQFISTQSAEIGFTAMSVVTSPKMKGKGKWIELDPALYQPIEQGVVVMSDKKEASDFYNFLFSKEAKKILTTFGYSVDE